MARRTYRPRIRRLRWNYNSLIGWFDFTFIGWWEAVGHGYAGTGATPKEAYDAWYKQFLMPYRERPEFVAAYQTANTPR